MRVNVDILAGICGFRTSGTAHSSDDQNVEFSLTSDCQKIANLLLELGNATPFDAYAEISTKPESGARFLDICRKVLSGCCSGCVIPAGLFKAMQVAARLALPKDICISLTKEV